MRRCKGIVGRKRPTGAAAIILGASELDAGKSYNGSRAGAGDGIGLDGGIRQEAAMEG